MQQWHHKPRLVAISDMMILDLVASDGQRMVQWNLHRKACVQCVPVPCKYRHASFLTNAQMHPILTCKRRMLRRQKDSSWKQSIKALAALMSSRAK